MGGYDAHAWTRDPAQHETVIDGSSGQTTIRLRSGSYGTVLDGLTVTGAQGDSGIYVDNTAATIANCRVFGNRGDYGGGIHLDGGSTVVISHTSVFSNVAEAGGGGIAVLRSSEVTLTHSAITNNSTGWGAAGGVGMWDNATVHASNCVIRDNSTASCGGGINPSDRSQLQLTNSLIVGNRASWGGAGVHCSDSTSSLTNVTVAGNTCANAGNCTVGVSNSGDTAVITITNSILALNPGGDLSSSQDKCAVSFSDVANAPWPGLGNISASPRFVSLAGGDYHLRSTSSCINAGTTTGAPAHDLENTPRDATPDMGAYEFVGEPSPATPDIRYVAPTGSDGGADSCLDPATPCRTIGYAIAQAEGGDWVQIGAGVYTENLTISKPLSLTGGYEPGGWNRDLGQYETVIDGSGGQTTIRLQNGSYGTMLDGLAVTGAQGDSGIYVDNTTATIANCRVFGNMGDYGGGIHVGDGSMVVISHTSAFSNVASAGGGGLAVVNSSVVTLTESIVSGNRTGWGSGGGLGAWAGSKLIAGGSIIRGNAAAAWGGGLHISDGAELELTNSLVVRNQADFMGAGVDNSNSTTILVNVTVADNFDSDGEHTAGVSNYGSGTVMTIVNSILAANQGGDLSPGEGTCAVSYSDVADAMRPGTGNISADPRFVDVANGDYHLLSDSPCIDAGTASGAPTHDLEGTPRDAAPDMGAYEAVPALPGDMDGDCDVDILDIMAVASRWRTRVGDARYDPYLDLDSDGDIDIVDIMRVASHWGETCTLP